MGAVGARANCRCWWLHARPSHAEGAGYRVKDATGHGNDLVITQPPKWEVRGQGAWADDTVAWRLPGVANGARLGAVRGGSWGGAWAGHMGEWLGASQAQQVGCLR